MKTTLETSTEMGLCFLADPAALVHLHWPEDRTDRERMIVEFVDGGFRREADEGRLFSFETGGDGPWSIDLYVDEQPPADLMSRASHKKAGLLLRVPSGRLQATGTDYSPWDDAHSAPKACTTVPAGDYVVDAYLFAGLPLPEPKEKTVADKVVSFLQWLALWPTVLGVAGFVIRPLLNRWGPINLLLLVTVPWVVLGAFHLLAAA